MLQEDGLICCRNKAKVLVRPKGMMMHSSENHEKKKNIKMVLGAEFDLTIAQTQIKDWKDSISRKAILSCFNTNKTRYPLITKEQSQIELLSFNSPSCCLSSTN
jgi:2-polyprenyl-3-methyl-5-hydroxy-6-metoxy-1,4-benzoquinol methylase